MEHDNVEHGMNKQHSFVIEMPMLISNLECLQVTDTREKFNIVWLQKNKTMECSWLKKPWPNVNRLCKGKDEKLHPTETNECHYLPWHLSGRTSYRKTSWSLEAAG